MTALLPPMEVAARRERLRPLLDDAGVDALLVTHLTNVRYLTGFTGSAGVLVIGHDRTTLVTDGRYADQAPAQVTASGAEVAVEIAGPDQRAVVARLLGSVPRLGLEADTLPWGQVRAWGAALGGTELVATSGVVESLREQKDEGEIARMRAAAAIADEALAAVLPMLATGPTEADFGRELDAAMRRSGASGPSFETIVASGPNAALPHARPGERRVGRGELVVLDFGAVVDGYCSDMTRTVCVGEPGDEDRRHYEVVRDAQAAGVAAVRAGVSAKSVDQACRSVIEAAGWGDRFTHGTGHGVGLDVHEAPRVAATATATLRPGHVVTVEPGVYLPSRAGVRVEDTVVVTDTGCVPLTLTPKELCVV